MAIEAGALSLRITEVGGDQVLAKLNLIDAKARMMGQQMQGVRFNVPSMTGVNGQLQAAQVNFTQVGAAATAAGSAVAAANNKAAASAGGMTAMLGTLGKMVGAYIGLQTAVRAYNAITDAADRQDTAQRKLSATARLTGESLATITGISTQAQQKFAISSSSAADLTQQFVKLAGRAGDVSMTGQLMSSWMDLAAAQGMTLNEVLVGVNSTLVGQDEGVNRLGLMNPSNLWKQWADAAGKTVAQMSEQEKWMAIVIAVMNEGKKVQGEYAKFLETTAGKQQQFNSELEQTAAKFGKAIEPMRRWAYEAGIAMAGAFGKLIDWYKRIDRERARSNARMGIGEAPAFTPFGPTPEQLKKARPTPAIVVTAPKPLTAAEREAAQLAAIERSLDRHQLAMPGLVDIKSPLAKPAGPAGTIPIPFPKGATLPADKEVERQLVDLQQEKGKLALGVGESIGMSLAAGFQSAFAGEDNFFAAFGKALLGSIGSILIQLGGTMIAYGAIVTPLLGLPGPFAALGLGAAASLAAGTALIALGAGMGAIAGGGKGKGGGAGGRGGGRGGRTAQQDQVPFSMGLDPDRKLGRSSPAVVPSARALSSGALPGTPQPVTVIYQSFGEPTPQAARFIAKASRMASGAGMPTSRTRSTL